MAGETFASMRHVPRADGGKRQEGGKELSGKVLWERTLYTQGFLLTRNSKYAGGRECSEKERCN